MLKIRMAPSSGSIATRAVRRFISPSNSRDFNIPSEMSSSMRQTKTFPGCRHFVSQVNRDSSNSSSSNRKQPSGRTFLKSTAAVFVSSVIGYKFMIKPYSDSKYKSISDEDLPKIYNSEELEHFWQNNHKIVAFTRKVDIFCTSSYVIFKSLKFAYDYYLKENPLKFASLEEEERTITDLAVKVRLLLEELGPTFVKAGQIMSTRPDLLPPAGIYELQKLCDSVPHYDSGVAIEFLKEQYKIKAGNDMIRENSANNSDPDDEKSQVIKEIEKQQEAANGKLIPIASASLGQVYKIRIDDFKSGDVKTIALKIQRPDMRKSVSLDLLILRNIVQRIESLVAKLKESGYVAKRAAFHMKLFESFAKATYLELDYINEAKNQNEFRNKLEAKLSFQNIYVPETYDNLSTGKILATEWIEGKELKKCDKETINRLVPVGVNCYLTQLLDLGIFHADPHPGNLLVEEKSQRLVLIDFGLCARISEDEKLGEMIRKNLLSSLLYLMSGDVRNLLNSMIKLEFLPEDVFETTTGLEEAVAKIYVDARLQASELFPFVKFKSNNLADKKIEEKLKKHKEKVEFDKQNKSEDEIRESSKYLRRKQLVTISKELNQVFFDYPFYVPEYFALITRALIILEGIALVGDPSFDI